MSAQRHQSAGQPSGGQFMTTTHAEPAVALGNPDGRELLNLGPMDDLDPAEQGVVRTRMGELREAGLTGHASEFEVVEADGVSFRLVNPDGNFIAHLYDDSFGVVRSKLNPTDPAHEWSADALVSVDPRGGGRITNQQIADTYSLAMAKSGRATRFAEQSGLHSSADVKFTLPELRKDGWARTVGSMDVSIGEQTYTVLRARGREDAEVYDPQGRVYSPRVAAAIFEDIKEAGGGSADITMIGNAIAVTVLEEGETW